MYIHNILTHPSSKYFVEIKKKNLIKGFCRIYIKTLANDIGSVRIHWSDHLVVLLTGQAFSFCIYVAHPPITRCRILQQNTIG